MIRYLGWLVEIRMGKQSLNSIFGYTYTMLDACRVYLKLVNLALTVCGGRGCGCTLGDPELANDIDFYCLDQN